VFQREPSLCQKKKQDEESERDWKWSLPTEQTIQTQPMRTHISHMMHVLLLYNSCTRTFSFARTRGRKKNAVVVAGWARHV